MYVILNSHNHTTSKEKSHKIIFHLVIKQLSNMLVFFFWYMHQMYYTGFHHSCNNVWNVFVRICININFYRADINSFWRCKFGSALGSNYNTALVQQLQLRTIVVLLSHLSQELITDVLSPFAASHNISMFHRCLLPHMVSQPGSSWHI